MYTYMGHIFSTSKGLAPQTEKLKRAANAVLAQATRGGLGPTSRGKVRDRMAMISAIVIAIVLYGLHVLWKMNQMTCMRLQK